MPISINGSGTITGISAGGLPDGVITTDDIAASAITRAKMGYAGAILQVAQALKTDTQSFAPSTSFSDVAGLSVSITPSSSSNKVLVFFSVNAGNGSDQSHLHIQLVRGSTAIGLGDAAGNRTQSTGGCINTATTGQVLVNSMLILDSPSTTSSTTYKLQAKCNSGGQISWVNRSTRDNNLDGYDGRCSSVIVVMEVAG